MQDPCSLNCIWKENKCQEITQADKGQINSERLFGFCVLGNKEIPYYDEAEKKLEKKPVAIKFAMYIEDLPPPPIEGLSVEDNKNAEHSVILKWKKSTAEDVDKYVIYYSETNFKDKSIEAINLDAIIAKKEIKYDEDNLLAFSSISLDSCELKKVKIDNKEEIRCVFDENKLIKNNQLYYVEDSKEAFYILSSIEDKNYYFAVTAVDKAGNEINNIDQDQKLALIEGKSEDDLGPAFVNFDVRLDKDNLIFSWPEVTSNLVANYALSDLNLYNLYYNGCADPTTIPLDKKEILPGNPTVKITANLPHCSPGSDTYNYYFFILAKDKLNNPDIEFNKLKELGLIIKEVSITDNKGGSFSMNSVTDRSIPSTSIDVDQGKLNKG